MNTYNQHTAVIQDGFETYFAEKLWEMIPAFYRAEDGLSENPGVLRSIIEIMARQAANLRRSSDRLWEDQFIELCDEWAIPYLADLLATRLVSAQNPRGRRADVGSTIAQRRRSGTLLLLEQLISRITDWDGTVKEHFRRLARTPHGLDPESRGWPQHAHDTPAGGTANLRSPRISELLDGPFSSYHYTPDVRQLRGKDGRYGIHKIGIYLYRLKAYMLRQVDPFPQLGHPEFNGTRFTFDPSGRMNPLFRPRQRVENWNQWRGAFEWELPAAIPCRLLGHAIYSVREQHIQLLQDDHGLTDAAASDLRRIRQQIFVNEYRFQEVLESLPNAVELTSLAIYLPLLAAALIDNCGKSALMREAIMVDFGGVEGPIATEQTLSANLSAPVTTAPDEKRLLIDPERGILQVLGGALEEAPTVSYHYGLAGNVGAGSYDRRSIDDLEVDRNIAGGGAIASIQLPNDGVARIRDSRTYGPISNKISVRNLHLFAANRTRPYIRLGSNWRLSTGANTESFATLDGLWLGASAADTAVIFQGDYECIQINHCTFDPGGDTDIFGDPIHPVSLVIEAQVDQLIVNASILGNIHIQNGGLVEELIICDSVIHSIDPTVSAIEQPLGSAQIDRTTIFGAVNVHRLFASEVLLTEIATVTDTQTGCFRFSMAPTGSRLPRPYPHAPMSFSDSSHWFTSRRFGDPGYAQLSETSPEELQRGAENGSEIGVFHQLANPIKADSLRNKISEYLPFGLLPQFINVT